MNTDKLKDKIDKIFNENINYAIVDGLDELGLKTAINDLLTDEHQLGRDEVIERVLEILDQNDFCKCDPLSSGEEHCNNGCVVRYSINQLKK